MTLRILIIFMLLMMFSSVLHGADRNADPEPGVARSLARFRAEHYSDVRYALQIEITPGAPLLKGTIQIRVKLDDEADQLLARLRFPDPVGISNTG